MIGADRVFMDVEDIRPGQNFSAAIDSSIAACQIALIVIGPRWQQILMARSLVSEPDYVAHEVLSALAHKLEIVPVLVGGAVMPRESEMPPALSGLPFYQAAELRDSTFREDCERLGKSLGLAAPLSHTLRRRWIAVTGVTMVVFAGLGVWGLRNSRSSQPSDLRLATARTQSELGEPRSAFYTYAEILKSDPGNRSVLDLQASAAMSWTREFRVTAGEGQKASDIAAGPLAEIIGVLEAALARVGNDGKKQGEILAHLGWAHWLNQRIAEREFGPAAEQAWRRALTVDPSNVVAHAMLGNWLLQNHGSSVEALQHFDSAVKTGSHRAFVRRMQLGGLIYENIPGIPAALMRVANEMRVNGEPLDDRSRSRILTYFRPGNTVEAAEMLASLKPSEAWATFLWLDTSGAANGGKNYEAFRREFVRAVVLEQENKPEEALALLTELGQRMSAAGFSGRLLDDVSSASRRLRSAAVRTEVQKH